MTSQHTPSCIVLLIQCPNRLCKFTLERHNSSSAHVWVVRLPTSENNNKKSFLFALFILWSLFLLYFSFFFYLFFLLVHYNLLPTSYMLNQTWLYGWVRSLIRELFVCFCANHTGLIWLLFSGRSHCWDALAFASLISARCPFAVSNLMTFTSITNGLSEAPGGWPSLLNEHV